jgi:DNA polymerase III sliding clamp (beta) subunit (PCNA family)
VKKTIDKKTILDIATKLSKYVPGNPVIDILSNFYVNDNSVTVDNQEVRITINIPQEDGINPLEGISVCLPARNFTDALRNMTSDKVTLNFKEGKVSVSDPAKKKGVEINSSPGENFLQKQEEKGDTLYLPVPAMHFLPALKKAATFADAERPDAYRGVGISVKGDKLYINGGNVSHNYQMEIDMPGIAPFNAVITVQGAKAIAEIEAEEIQIEKRGSFIFCSNDTVSVQARVLEGKYPDMTVFTSKHTPPFSQVDVQDVESAQNICSTIKDKDGLNLIELTPMDGAISFYSINTSGEFARQDIPATNGGIVGKEVEGEVIGHWVNNAMFKKCLSIITQDYCFLDNKAGVLFISPLEQPIGVKEVAVLALYTNN